MNYKTTAHIRISPNVAWVEPFLDGVSSLVNLKRVSRVMGYTVKPGKIERQFAGVTDRDGKCTISLLLEENAEGKTVPLGIALEALAHELAHLKYWKHTANHFRFQAALQIEFAKIAEQEGVKDMFKRLKRVRKAA